MDLKITRKQSIYLELAEKIESFIALGFYKENEKLPSCRKLVIQLNVSPNTVERVYSLLEKKGTIYTLPKKGVYVKPKHDQNKLEDEIKTTTEHFISDDFKQLYQSFSLSSNNIELIHLDWDY